MAWAYDGSLDMLGNSANQLSIVNTAMFIKNVRSYLQNAVHQIQPSNDVFAAMAEVESCAQRLVSKTSASFSPNIDVERKEFSDAVEKLRALMEKCPPSEIAVNLGLG